MYISKMERKLFYQVSYSGVMAIWMWADDELAKWVCRLKENIIDVVSYNW